MRRLAAAALLAAALGACSSGAIHLHPQGPSTQTILVASMHTSGALVVSARYTSSTGPNGVANCALAAARGNSLFGQFAIGSPGTFAAPVYFGFRTVTYAGPGSYRQAQVRLDTVSTVLDHVNVLFRRVARSTLSMTINPDASGRATFTRFVSDDGRTLDATVSWTCKTQGAL